MQADWHSEMIKARIRMTGTTLEALALAHKLDRSAVRATLLRPWPRVQAIIAQHLETTPQQIWPSRYGPDGRPLRGLHQKRRHRSPAAATAQRQKGAAR